MTEALSSASAFMGLVARVSALDGGSLTGNATVAGTITARGLTADIPGVGNGGYVQILGATPAGYTGIVEFHQANGTRNGFVGFNPDGGAMQYGSDSGAGHNFTGGPITAPALSFDTAFSLAVLGGNPTVMVDPSSSIAYNRTTKKFLFFIDGVVVASIDGSGNLKTKGTLTQSTTP